MHLNEIKREFKEEYVCCPGGSLVAVAEGGLGPFFGRRCDHVGSPVGGGLGHALFVRAIACDLLWRKGWASVFEVQGGGGEVFPVSIAFLSVISCNGKMGTMKEQTLFAISMQGRRGSN
ncbi:hypothetical protein CRG98_029588 [Punica granatum]|uniref:Uncharacterized protein n=1 Tax=Punica granatum TaxID=22663 RepID=A0A2I0J1C0_PUNGR|nr:hypothetical protein CRG98_029588 [Punica granatum]